jgi:hypothetical protein
LKPELILVPAAALCCIAATYLSVLNLIRAWNRTQKEPAPSTHNLIRMPGQSAAEKIDGLDNEFARRAAQLIALALFLSLIYLCHLYVYKSEVSAVLIRIFLPAGSCLSVYILLKTLQLAKERRREQQAYEDEIVVARELDRLTSEGNHVYHDIPAEDFNIDHVVVGRTGIFAVESGARLKSAKTKRLEDATVEYNGRMLMFPGGDDYKTIEQAERQASWISDWISRAVGEQVAARAIVALPGWFVKRTSAEGISVVNPEQFPALFRHIKPRYLSDETITRIVAELEQRCRTFNQTTF